MNAHTDDLTNALRAVFAAAWVKAGNDLPIELETRMPLSESVQDEAEALYMKLSDETDRMLEEHWRKVQRVARALERHDWLDQSELDRLIDVSAQNNSAASEQNARSIWPGAATQ